MRDFFYKYSPHLFMLGLVLLGFFLGGFFRSGIFYDRPKVPSSGETAMWAEKVGSLVVLPEGEVPTIAAVSNPEVLKGQAFFAEAKTGDIVLIYSKKAVLYDPILNKVIIAAPVNSGSTNQDDLVPKFQGEQIKVDDPSTENQF